MSMKNWFMMAVAGLALAVSSGMVRAEDKDIVDTAVEAKFSKLVAAVKAAELVETLKGKGPFTVFAPTDKAFEALGEETLNAVLKDKEKLTAILTYHVVPGEVMAKDAVALAKDGKSAKTVQGGEIKLSIEDGKVKLNGEAVVIKTDIKTKNGVIHIIDKVIMPPK
ncbi:MAG: fasciclin domain-containing protein [Gemmataceae bacterium]